jgi:hypothetical protein
MFAIHDLLFSRIIFNWRCTHLYANQHEDDFEHTLENIKKMRGADVQPFLKPIVVLSSPRTFSAAEDFLVAFKPLKRGLIVGEPSGGSTGQPLIISLPGGLGSRGRPCEELLAIRLPMTVSAVLWITLKRKVCILPSLTSN